MAKPLIHPNWDKPRAGITDGFSLEMTAKDEASLRDAAPLIPAETPVAITYLPGEEVAARVAATVAVRELGFEPMPHFSARRITSEDDFEGYLKAVVEQAGVRRCFIVAGDPPEPQGPYFDTMALIETGAFERAGITAIGIGGHPEGHPNMSVDQCWQVLETKVRAIEARGMAPLVVTQFGFDPDAFLAWLKELRARGIDCPVRIGVPGPAGIKRLLAFAARCGVGASASVMKKYGVSIGNLLGTAGPDRLVDAFAAGLGDEHGRVRLHFYPFGGMVKTVEWIRDYNAKHGI
ncbi:methylenetetrahydrofolate reductase [Novosphingobium sp.]|jgi:methylenetetrahydrofolate reductase (NADPH)|uniref:methylenetetrahydrofolate reductase n=1 Tax=Novosphingobium sp. TaxID=1874826 RepID=UPI001EB8B576|nr:methylenetetrahydrofolate reductase [Novosphingobium sp.]MBK6802203.1 methylenetetrahydrofolate reductase [Novosphingobium sp.]MBK9009740.1 methylenetetrahydrofolate reductase [Novosphingobium sp.]